MSHPTSDLNDVVHQRSRLGILSIAAEASQVEFGFLRDTLGLTPGNLSRHLDVLYDAGLIPITKGYHGRRPKTWVTLTKDGRTALSSELAALSRLIHQQAGANGGTASEKQEGREGPERQRKP
jgi:DNA-binding MarR family transcriptional regulator